MCGTLKQDKKVTQIMLDDKDKFESKKSIIKQNGSFREHLLLYSVFVFRSAPQWNHDFLENKQNMQFSRFNFTPMHDDLS